MSERKDVLAIPFYRPCIQPYLRPTFH
jgi:hypothetical protein